MSNSTSRPGTEDGDQAGKTVHDAHGLALEAGATAPSAVERFKATLAGLQARAKDVAGAVRRRAVQTDKKIRAKPYHALGIAAGAGIVAGYLISRRRSSS
jgi:ElaB/YqjD/DUF883 family membrane-anchored ribosome-binding protein